MKSKLYIVATPIGNLGDISARALEVLREVDVIVCEDTRVTGKLLKRYEISKPTKSLHQHTSELRFRSITDLLVEGKDLAYVSDAGTPNISDPGGLLVATIAGMPEDIEIIPIPGASACITALSVSGFPADRFIFLGFPPHKKGRQTFFKELNDIKHTIVFYESTHRILKALASLEEFVPNRNIVVCRELTKMHESIYRGQPGEVTKQLEADSIKGEFVIVIGPKKK